MFAPPWRLAPVPYTKMDALEWPCPLLPLTRMAAGPGRCPATATPAVASSSPHTKMAAGEGGLRSWPMHSRVVAVAVETANGEWGWTLAAWHRPAGRGAGRSGGGHRPSAGRGGERWRWTARSQVSAGRGSLRRPPRPTRSWALTGPVSIATHVPVVGRARSSRGCMNTPGCGCIIRGCSDAAGASASPAGTRTRRGIGTSGLARITRGRGHAPGHIPRVGCAPIPRGCVHGPDVRAFAGDV